MTKVFNIIAIILVSLSIGIYFLFLETKQQISEVNYLSEVQYTQEIAKNLSDKIKKDIGNSKCVYNYFDKHKHQKLDMEDLLSSFISTKYRYIYVLHPDFKNKNRYVFLLDGAKDKDQKSSFSEEYIPDNIKKYNMVFETKKPILMKENGVDGLWMTYLYPVIVKGKVDSIIVIDFSLQEIQSINKSLDYFDTVFMYITMFFIAIFIVILWFAYQDNKRQKEKDETLSKLQATSIILREQSTELSNLNDTLEIRIKEEVEKNHRKDQMMLQQSRLAQMGEMISMIAHQWRQPLSAISATAEAIRLKSTLEVLDSQTTEDLTTKIIAYGQHLSSTIDDFRNFYKTNKIKEFTTYNEIINSIMQIIEISIKTKNIKIITELNSNTEFETYPNELKQVLLNLVKNAEDILIEKDIKDAYIIIKTYEENNKLFLEVHDNAGGISDDIIDKIFDPYFSTKNEKNGTGLGLYMSKTIIEEHCGGILSVKNNDKGAVFTVELRGGGYR